MSRKSYSSLLQTVTLIIGLKMAQQRPLFCFFSVFSNKHRYNFYNKSMWKTSCPSSILSRDSNPWPLEHDPPPITTRPGLPPLDNWVKVLSVGVFNRPLVQMDTSPFLMIKIVSIFWWSNKRSRSHNAFNLSSKHKCFSSFFTCNNF